MKIALTTPNLYSSKPSNKQNVSFNGLADKSTNVIAKGIIKATNTKVFEGAVDFTKRHNNVDKYLYPHLIVFGSTLLSGFYVLKTLQNKQLEDKKRKTLAINQGLTWALSTVLAYSFDIAVNDKFTSLVNKFKEVNKSIQPDKLDNMCAGLKVAKSMIAVDLVYRFIAPVIVTPIANRIGNRINDQKTAKKVALDKQA